MDLFKALIFNRGVLGLIIGACLIVGAMNLYLDNVRIRLLYTTAPMMARNQISTIAALTHVYNAQFVSQGVRVDAAAIVSAFDKNLKKNGKGMSLQLIRPDSKKDPFQQQAFQTIIEKKRPDFYQIQPLNNQKVLRYAISNSIFQNANQTVPSILELNIPLGFFEKMEVDESAKILWVLALTAILTTIVLAIFMGRLRYSAEVLAEANRNLAKVNKDLELEREEIRRLNAELQQRVISRTKQLQEANEELSGTLTKLKETETFLNNIINSMPSVLIIVDNNLNIIQANNRTKTEIAMPLYQIIGKPLFEIFDYLANYANTFKKTLEDRTIHKIDSISHISGTEKYYFDVIIYPIFENKKQYLVVRIDDVTERVSIGIKLAQSDKMASLGVLTAGVAHEINNPINFISSTVTPLIKNISDILNVVTKYRTIPSEADYKSELIKINEYVKQIDLEYTVEETPKLLEAIKDGAERTAGIVRELRTFTRTDEDVMKKADIQAGLDSTINILKSRYKNRIEIIKDYGNIPPIDCYPGKINQVFMNILSNAIDSIEDTGKIFLTTRLEGDSVVIKIKDTGIGIKPEIAKKIFEPFFTTKAVAAGTGLGLSISYGIIQEHHGSIEFTSVLNQGSEFTITLPVSQK